MLPLIQKQGRYPKGLYTPYHDDELVPPTAFGDKRWAYHGGGILHSSMRTRRHN